MVAKFPFAPPKADDRKSADFFNLPRLFGRGEVDLIIKEIPKKGKAAVGAGGESTTCSTFF
jgi:hypothetical protein